MLTLRPRSAFFASLALITAQVSAAHASPLGSSVVAGDASVSGEGTANVIITQSTDRAIIDWNTFDIGVDEATQFVQPGADSVTLNRVTGGLGVSTIDGILNANGNVFLINPDGILFGKGSTVDVGGLVATTNDIANDDFMAGKYRFTQAGKTDASAVNLGTITARDGGFAALVAPGVRNAGTISARLGHVDLASANAFTLDFYGDDLLTLGVAADTAGAVTDVQTGQPLDAIVKNEGTLRADGGTVQLTAAAARKVVDSVINNTGVVEANSVGTRNGKIVLSAATASNKPADAPFQKVKVSGTLQAKGASAGETGGKVQVTGEDIVLAGATIDASGSTGGGTVLVGGDVGGGKPAPVIAGLAKAQKERAAVATSANVSGDAYSSIDASAIANGDGGKVVVWADGITTFAGTATVSGGEYDGDGGFAEISGKEILDYNGLVNMAAVGERGTLLLDPTNVAIGGVGGISVSSLTASLASGNVVVTTSAPGPQTGTITVAAPISWNSASTLTLNANDLVVIGAAINAPNGGLAISSVNGSSSGSAINVDRFTLQAGVWQQINPSLPNFFARDFRINGGTFLRATGGDGTSGNPLLIGDVYAQAGAAAATGYFALTNDINASGTAQWNGGAGFNPINFNGHLDGRGHVISGLYSTKGGLFSQIGANAVISNLGVINATISGPQDVGILANRNDGSVQNVWTSGNVAGPSAGLVGVGGLVGINGGQISQSHSSATVTGGDGSLVGGLVGESDTSWATVAISQSYATGTVKGGGNAARVGGLVGFNRAIFADSYATGNVSGGLNGLIGGLVGANDNLLGGGSGLGQILRSYATGNVTSTAAAAAGGLAGFNVGAIHQAFATGNVSGAPGSAVGGLVGLNFGLGNAPADYDSYIGQAYATGSVSTGANGYAGGLVGIDAGFILEAYSTGKVSAGSGSAAGGLVGSNSYVWGPPPARTTGLATSAYWNTDTSSQPSGVEGTGRATGQLSGTLPAGFTSGDWAISSGSYPHFSWQPAGTVPRSAGTPSGFDPYATSQVAASILSNSTASGDVALLSSSTSGAQLRSLQASNRFQRGWAAVARSAVVRDLVEELGIKISTLSGVGGGAAASMVYSRVEDVLASQDVYQYLQQGDYLSAVGTAAVKLADFVVEIIGASRGQSWAAFLGIYYDCFKIVGAASFEFVQGYLFG